MSILLFLESDGRGGIELSLNKNISKQYQCHTGHLNYLNRLFLVIQKISDSEYFIKINREINLHLNLLTCEVLILYYKTIETF